MENVLLGESAKLKAAEELQKYFLGQGLAVPKTYESQVNFIKDNKSCADLAVLCTKVILSDYNFAAHYPGLNDKWEELKRQKELHYADARGWLNEPDQDATIGRMRGFLEGIDTSVERENDRI